MILGLLMVGLIAGTMLFLGKFVIYSLIMTIFPKRFKEWIYRTPLAMVVVDGMFAFLAAPIAGMAGGTIAMLTMITFAAWSGLFICYKIVLYKSTSALNKLTRGGHPAW